MKVTKLYVFRLLCSFLSSVAIALFWQNTPLTSLVLFFLVILICIKSTKAEIIYLVIVSILASFMEALAMSSGAWNYSIQQLLNFPIWLPLYWGISSIVLKDTYLLIKFSIEK